MPELRARLRWGLGAGQALEDRFQALVEGSLAAAFQGRRGDQVAQLAGMMAAVGRASAVQKLYISARTPPIQVERSHAPPPPPARGRLPASPLPLCAPASPNF